MPIALVTNTGLEQYLITLIMIKGELDEENCPDFGGTYGANPAGCTESAQAQFYYEVGNGGRAMESACMNCLVSAVRQLVAAGQRVTVEVPRG